MRRISIATGVLLVVATATVLVADAVRPALTGAEFLGALPGRHTALAAAALLYLAAAGTSVGVAVALYPVLRTVDATLALGAVVFRTIEAVFYTAAVVSLLSLLPLARRLATAAPDQLGPISLLADSLVAQRDQASLVAVFAFCVGATMYYLALYRARLVPRWLSGWGLVAVALLLASCLLALFGDGTVVAAWPLVLPIAVQEMVLAVWLLVRGLSGDRTATVPPRSQRRSGAPVGADAAG